ncbi:Protein phosphatase methylesterase 1 [Mycena kentingensis (nom. inval.)]|nr:Protein phosphatase methylesterase 1 [Mycena kentingensis (nom. inval.)]
MKTTKSPSLLTQSAPSGQRTRLFAVPRLRPKSTRNRAPNPDFAPLSVFQDCAEAIQFEGGTVLVCHHGAGYSGLRVAKQVGVLSLDARRHGKTLSTASSEPSAPNTDTLVVDFVVIKYHLGFAGHDVVEGSAIEAPPHVQNLLNALSDGWDSIEEAAKRHAESKTIRNTHSAHVSVPSIIQPVASSSDTPQLAYT